MRLSKYLSLKGLCSRREADQWITNGWVRVDGVVAHLGQKVDQNSKVELAADAKQSQADYVTVMLNKHIGWVSAQPEPPYKPAIELLTVQNHFGSETPKVSPRNLHSLPVAGRLDIDSQGLLLFTQDGRLAKRIIGNDSEIEKEYLVRVDGKLTEKQLQLMRHGMVMDDEPLKPALVEWLNEDQLRIVLTEGKKRQVRRMCEASGLFVLALKRVRVGKLVLGNLPEGKWRYVHPDEI